MSPVVKNSVAALVAFGVAAAIVNHRSEPSPEAETVSQHGTKSTDASGTVLVPVVPKSQAKVVITRRSGPKTASFKEGESTTTEATPLTTETTTEQPSATPNTTTRMTDDEVYQTMISNMTEEQRTTFEVSWQNMTAEERAQLLEQTRARMAG